MNCISQIHFLYPLSKKEIIDLVEYLKIFSPFLTTKKACKESSLTGF